MSLAAVAANQIQASQTKLLAPRVLASYLLENTFLLLDKQSIEPLHESRMSINSASGIVELEVLTDISMSNSFCTTTSQRLETEIRKTIGHSPDIIDDIVKPIKKAIQGMIDWVIEPIKGVVDWIKYYVKEYYTSTIRILDVVKNGVILATTSAITFSEGVITKGVDFVSGQVTSLLGSVCDLANSLFLVLEKIFAALGNTFKGLLSMEPKDIINLQMELTKLAGETIVKAAKPSA